MRFSFSFKELKPKLVGVKKNGKIAIISVFDFDVFSLRLDNKKIGSSILSWAAKKLL